MSYHTPSPITLVIADDHPVFLRGLENILQNEKDLTILAEAPDGRVALDAIGKHKPQVALLDVEMPFLSGLDIAEQIRASNLPTAVILLTMHDDPGIFQRAIDIGVMGYILKDCAVTDIARGIRRVVQGDQYISPELANILIGAHAAADEHIEQKLGISRLTPAERRVLRLISMDKSTKEIAEELYVSPRTVEHHRSHIMSKLDLSGGFALLRFALEYKRYL